MADYGIQLYSLRDIADKDFEGMLKAVSDMGYKIVESAGFFGHSAETVKGWLDKYGLTLTSTHTGYGLLKDDFDATVAYHKAVGCKHLIIPGAPIGTKAEVDALVDSINKWQPLLEKEGITLHFHNHHREFLPNKDGVITMDELASRTKILFEIDTFWAYVAGEDPVAVMDKYGDRVQFIHLKDGFKDGEGKSLGQGTAPVAEVLEKAVATGRTVVVESEGLDPTGAEEVQRCMDYLRDTGM